MKGDYFYRSQVLILSSAALLKTYIIALALNTSHIFACEASAAKGALKRAGAGS